MFDVWFLHFCSFDAPTCICELSYTFPGSILLPVGLAGWWVFLFLNGQPLCCIPELYDFQ